MRRKPPLITDRTSKCFLHISPLLLDKCDFLSGQPLSRTFFTFFSLCPCENKHGKTIPEAPLSTLHVANVYYCGSGWTSRSWLHCASSNTSTENIWSSAGCTNRSLKRASSGCACVWPAGTHTAVHAAPAISLHVGILLPERCRTSERGPSSGWLLVSGALTAACSVHRAPASCTPTPAGLPLSQSLSQHHRDSIEPLTD